MRRPSIKEQKNITLHLVKQWRGGKEVVLLLLIIVKVFLKQYKALVSKENVEKIVIFELKVCSQYSCNNDTSRIRLHFKIHKKLCINEIA